MSIQERDEYGKALALIERHGMVAVTEERMQRLQEFVKAVEKIRNLEKNDGWKYSYGDTCEGELSKALRALEGDTSSPNPAKD